MKPKLLITLGCSWTEGVGCYYPPINYNINTPSDYVEKIDVIEKYRNENLHNFHKYGWPNKLGIKLGFDKVVNLGYGGASNSYSIKILYEYLAQANIEKYETLIVWLMTEPVRFSFYIDGKLKNYLKIDGIENPLAAAYLDEITSIDLDPLLEHKFYLKTLETLCELKNIGLVVTSWNNSYKDLYKIYKSKSYLHKTPIVLEPPLIKNENGDLKNYSFCSHPNENGYEWIANEMIKGIKKNHRKWYSEKENPNIQWEYHGKPKAHKSNVI